MEFQPSISRTQFFNQRVDNMKGLICMTLLALVAVVSGLGRDRIGGTPATPATTAFHSVLIMVRRNGLADGLHAFGGGSIVTRNRVITAAHVVRGTAVTATVGFYNGRFEASRFRRVTADFILRHPDFVATTYANDLAILSFPENTFPAANVISVGTVLPTTGNGALASYGFTSATATTPTQFPLLAAHDMAGVCTEVIRAQPSHFCAGTRSPSVVCPGDNGSGLSTGTGAAERLVGIVSIIQPGCVPAPAPATATLVGFTNLVLPAVQDFLRSQNIVPQEVVAETE